MLKKLNKLAIAATLAASLAISSSAHAFNYFPAAADNYNWTVYRSDGNYSGIDTAHGWVAQWNVVYLRYFTPPVATDLAGALQTKPTGSTVSRVWWPAGSAFVLQSSYGSTAQKNANGGYFWSDQMWYGCTVLGFSEIDSAYMIDLFSR